MKKLAVIMAAVAILAVASFANGAMDRRGMGAGMMSGCGMDGQMMGSEQDMSKYLMDLNLDKEQKASIGAIKTRMKKESIRKTADMRIIQIDLRDLLLQDNVDMKAVEEKLKELETLKTDMCLSHIKDMEECKAKLTPEQRQKLREMMAAMPMMTKMGMKHHQRRGMKGKAAGMKSDTPKDKTE